MASGVAGLLHHNEDPVGSAVRCGLEMASTLIDADLGWEVRTGVHSGPVVAGVVGQKRYQFDIWGGRGPPGWHERARNRHRYAGGLGNDVDSLRRRGVGRVGNCGEGVGLGLRAASPRAVRSRHARLAKCPLLMLWTAPPPAHECSPFAKAALRQCVWHVLRPRLRRTVKRTLRAWSERRKIGDVQCSPLGQGTRCRASRHFFTVGA
jgi:hypothetical protein